MKEKKVEAYVAPLLLLLLFSIIWLIPDRLGIVKEASEITKLRSDLKDLFNIFYVVITLWLVIITKKTLEINLYAQKAINEPMIETTLIVDQQKPIAEKFEVQSLRIEVMPGANYIENAEGASIYLLLKNANGFGKATNIYIKMKIEATIPDKIDLNRDLSFQYLVSNQAVAIFIYRFEKPSIKNSININSIEITYTNPFDQASNLRNKVITFNENYQIEASGDMVNSISYGKGVKAIH